MYTVVYNTVYDILRPYTECVIVDLGIYSTIGTSELSTCYFYLIAGLIDEKNFCYLLHSSKSYQSSDEETAVSIIKNITYDITTLHIFRPREHPNRINISKMKDLKMFVGGGGEDKTSQDLPQKALQLINNDKYNKIQELLTNEDERLLVKKLYKNITILPPTTFIVDDQTQVEQAPS